MKNKNWFLVIIIFIAALLIAIVFWVYAKRIEHIENKMIHAGLQVHCASTPADLRHFEIM
jgi:hypothetical protein